MKPDNATGTGTSVARLDALTGLRFLAALAVFVHHVATRYHVEHIKMPLGAIAVSFFFVLSGFILTYVYHQRLKRGGLKKFYFTRVARIWPLHAVCLGALFVMFPMQMHVLDAPYEQLKVASHWLLLQSWVPNHSWIFTMNGVAWSISTEMFFYLMFPLLLLGGQQKFWRKYCFILGATLLAVIGVSYLAKIPSLNEQINFRTFVHVNPAMRLIEFATGMGTGYVFLNRASKRNDRGFVRDTLLESVGICLAAGYYWAFRSLGVYGFLREAVSPYASLSMVYSGGALFFAIAIYIFATSNGLWGRLLRTKTMVFLGEVSFAFYMCHQLVLRWAFGKQWIGSDLTILELSVCCCLLAIGISSLLYLLVEIPMKNALLKLYARDWKAAAREAFTPVGKLVTSKQGLITAMLFVAPLGYFEIKEEIRDQQPTAVEIVNRTEPTYRDVTFGEDIQLVGYNVVPRRMGVQVNLVWKKLSNRPANRYVYFCEPGGKEITSIRLNNVLGGKHKIGDLRVERLFIHQNKYKNAFAIAVGFQSRQNEPMLAKSGPRTADMQKLYVVRKQRLANLSGTLRR